MSDTARILLSFATVGVCLVCLIVFSLLGITSGKMAIIGLIVALLSATGAFLGVHAAINGIGGKGGVSNGNKQ